METVASPRKECVVSNMMAPLLDVATQSLCPAHVPLAVIAIVLSQSMKHGVVHVAISNPLNGVLAFAVAAMILQSRVPILIARSVTAPNDLPITTIFSPPSTRHFPPLPSQYASTIVNIGSVGAEVGTAVVGDAVVGIEVGTDVVGMAVGRCVWPAFVGACVTGVVVGSCVGALVGDFVGAPLGA